MPIVTETRYPTQPADGWHEIGGPSHAWPDWPDEGRRIQMETEIGGIVTGNLTVGDFFPDDQGDEVPVFYVRDTGGAEYSFCDAVRWRFLL